MLKELMMRNHDPIQLDAAIVYRQAAIRAIQRALSETHGDAFADAFLYEYHHAVAKAARTRLCGLCEAGVIDATRHLLGAPEAR
jgi:hypothetical protein